MSTTAHDIFNAIAPRPACQTLGKRLAEYGTADVSIDGKSALIYAVETGNYLAIPILASYGADLNRKDPATNLSPLQLAYRKNWLEVFSALVEAGADTAEVLHDIAHCNGVKFAAAIKKHCAYQDAVDGEGNTPFLAALKTAHLGVARVYADCGASLYSTNDKGENAALFLRKYPDCQLQDMLGQERADRACRYLKFALI